MSHRSSVERIENEETEDRGRFSLGLERRILYRRGVSLSRDPVWELPYMCHILTPK